MDLSRQGFSVVYPIPCRISKIGDCLEPGNRSAASLGIRLNTLVQEKHCTRPISAAPSQYLQFFLLFSKLLFGIRYLHSLGTGVSLSHGLTLRGPELVGRRMTIGLSAPKRYPSLIAKDSTVTYVLTVLCTTSSSRVYRHLLAHRYRKKRVTVTWPSTQKPRIDISICLFSS